MKSRKAKYHARGSGKPAHPHSQYSLRQYRELEKASDTEPHLWPYWVTRQICLKGINLTTLRSIFSWDCPFSEISGILAKTIKYLSQLMRLWYLSHRQHATAQVSLRIREVQPESSLFAHMKYGSRQRVQPKVRHLALLDSCACAFEEWVYGGP